MTSSGTDHRLLWSVGVGVPPAKLNEKVGQAPWPARDPRSRSSFAARWFFDPATFVARGRVAVCLLAATFAAVLGAADRRPVPWEKHRLLIGQALYRENCVVCHEIDREQSKKPGPSFYQLFKRDKMPLSNMKPGREYIKVRVKFGGALMPAFRKTLTDAEIDTLIDYIAAR